MSEPESTAAIVERARAGDREAFTRLVGRFQAMAYGYAYSILGDFALAEDAAQEAFLEAHYKLGDLRQAAAFPGWFRRIVFKHCDRITRRRRIQTVSLDTLALEALAAETRGEVASRSPGPQEALERRETQEDVRRAIRSLPPGQREATTLYYIAGYSQREVAAFLDLPLSTVKNRLSAARKRLKERMIAMVETTLHQHKLPEDFARRLLRYPFPRHEPEVEIVDLPGGLPHEALRVRCTDAQSHFVPLAEDGKCDWTFYDWPGARLTGVYECHVIASARWKGGTLLREWRRYNDLEEGAQEWQEDYLLVEDDTFRWVEIQRDGTGGLDLSAHHYPGGQASEPVPMTLEPGARWGTSERSRVLGVARVRVGEQAWNCLKVAMTSDQGAGNQDGPAVLAELYVADTGRTVFFRRYNGPGWREAGKAGSFESLAGNLQVAYEGHRYRHWYDCIPDHAIERALG
jgi:RNA polymerase sigma factor (sigma-70 family)